MASSHLTEPLVIRSGSSVHSREEDEYVQSNVDNPLEVSSSASVNKYGAASSTQSTNNNHDPPPPYQEVAPPEQTAPNLIEDGLHVVPIEHSSEFGSQSIAATFSQATEDLPELSPYQSPGSPALLQGSSLASTPVGPTLPNDTAIRRRPVYSASSSDLSRGFGDEKRPPTPERSYSASSSSAGLTVLSPASSIQHTREQGKVTAYLVPFPKPRIKNVKPEDIPDRFLIYSPPLPPLSKPDPGEKETHWHKARRQWQEDVRKATMQEASATTWKGMKAKSTLFLRQGVAMTMSTTGEFLDRASGATIHEADTDAVTQSPNASTASIAELPETSLPSDDQNANSQTPSTDDRPCAVHNHDNHSTSGVGEKAAPKPLEELTLVYPPALTLSPEDIRAEFVNALVRSRDKSMKDAVVSSSLLPFAAALDASLIVTFGGLTGSAAAWAYTSTRGIKTSNEITKGISLSEEQATREEEVQGCSCGHHTTEFGPFHVVTKSKDKRNSVNLRLQQSPSLDVLRHYLYKACLDKEFSMFPHTPFAEKRSDGAVDEEAVLRTIGWKPTSRRGNDLEMEIKGKVETLTTEQDMAFQVREAREDVKRIFKKAAAEWISWCKAFQKDPKEAMKK